ncbi:YafY family transcriptional regulator [Paenibacillus sp. sptzw28]|uniref:helix-turn-helix transcriptional regulator n=1 Tax=Paenibacillus sp. sptzw28 TaxID=715179 RepID=UPI001C6E803B|nr:YafY family protein [Paenibacillus sp. sptzw28]QYR20946.1 YafY family transcriptional regulator [Paenibacillus sp. sptzw28]
MLKSQRLIQLIMVINAKKSFTAGELADEFGLSTRTITRDLQELSTLGIPIYSVQGRGGGYRLLRERMLPPITFSESEAVAMFFACQSLQYYGSLPFDEGAAAALHKFYHYLPADVKEQIERLRNKVAIWSPHRSMSSACLRTLLQAVMIRSAVTIRYKSSHIVSDRDIQPIGLYASQGYWYCPAYCFHRKAYRLFRGDRISSASLNPSIECLEEVDKRSVKDWNEQEILKMDKTELIFNLTPNGVRTLESSSFDDSIQCREDGSGTVRKWVPKEDLSFFVNIIWGLGEDAEIVEPAEAVDLIKRKIEKIKNVYQ